MTAKTPLPRAEILATPDSMAQLEELLAAGDVVLLHVHRFRVVDVAGDDGVFTGACSCGATKQFDPHGAVTKPHGITINGNGSAPRKCSKCNKPGHTARSCGA